MRTFGFVTVDVFTDRRFGGNPLAVFPDASGLSDGEMQSLAAEFNLSETTFVVPPENPANTARVRIFNRTSEMPFAGHPNVGTGWVLAGLGRDHDGMLRFEEIAGLVEVKVEREAKQTRAVTIAAPQPLTLGAEMPVDLLAACIGLSHGDIVATAHRPVVASVGNSFCIVEVAADALSRAVPDYRTLPRSREVVHRARPQPLAALPLRACTVPIGCGRGCSRRSPARRRIRRPAAPQHRSQRFCLSLGGDSERRYQIRQGVEMGRPSLLLCTARRGADGIRASVGGGCVPVLKGEVSL